MPQLKKHLIEGKKIAMLYGSPKYYISEKNKEVKDLLKAEGAKLTSRDPDFFLLARQMGSLHYVPRETAVLFDKELLASPAEPAGTYFKGLEQRIFDMVRALLQKPNICVNSFNLGLPKTEQDFAKIEKALKKPIPAAVKEFYGLFGHFFMLWEFRNADTDGRVRYVPEKSLFIHSGQNEGCFNFRPLQQVMLENWNNPDYHFGFPEGTDIKIVDPYSYSHLIGIDIDSGDDPLVYLGRDHGAEFVPLGGLRFSEYVHRMVGCFGFLNRFTDTAKWINGGKGYLFAVPGAIEQPDAGNIALAAQGFVDLNTVTTPSNG